MVVCIVGVKEDRASSKIIILMSRKRRVYVYCLLIIDVMQ